MILHALNDYYNRMVVDSNSKMPSYGYSNEGISFALELSLEGELLGVEDLRVLYGKKLGPRKMLVPAAEKKASGIKSNFLWDNTTYVLGQDDKDKPERAEKCLQAFIDRIQEVCGECNIQTIDAITSFFEKLPNLHLTEHEMWPDICGTNLVFRLSGSRNYVHDQPEIREAWLSFLANRPAEYASQCLVTGKTQQAIARLHPSVKGVRGAQSSGASIVSFNKNSFKSYNKDQSFNAPVSEEAVFAYTTALNALLDKDSHNKLSVGDSTIVFWAERATPAEAVVRDLFDPPIKTKQKNSKKTDKQDDTGTAALVRSVLKAVSTGKHASDVLPELEEDVTFYILGLAPNASRLSVRFWQVNTLGEILRRVGKHYADMRIVREYESEAEYPPLWLLLSRTAMLGKSSNVSPVLAGAMFKAVISGRPYPHALLPAVLGRIRAEQEVGYYRAALLMGYLKRNCKMEDLPMSLNTDRMDEPYLLGRLFAVLERAQESAIPNANTTIKDRFLASASATPGKVFHLLLNGAANHLSKLRKKENSKGTAIHLEKMLQDIINELDTFKSALAPEEQGVFMIGYYHQRKDFFTKKSED